MVRTDPGKSIESPEFNVEIFKALKIHENDHRYGKYLKKMHENCNDDLENADIYYTVDFPGIC